MHTGLRFTSVKQVLVKHYYTLVALLLLIIGAQDLVAQNDLLLAQYDRAYGYYNPAYAGMRKDVFITALHNRQWEGMPGSAKSFVLLADAPIRFMDREHGVGVRVVTQTVGLFSVNELMGQYAFKQKLFGGDLSVAIQAGFVNTAFDGTGVVLETENDPAIPLTKVNGKSFDAAAGVYYQRKNLYVGFSSTRLTAPAIPLTEQYILDLPRHYYLLAGYNIRSKFSLFAWHPSIFAATDGYSSRLDVKMGMSYNDRFFASLMYRPTQAVGVHLGMQLGKLYAGYAFEWPTSALAKASWGSHELLVSYSFPLSPAKNRDAKYKSIRFL